MYQLQSFHQFTGLDLSSKAQRLSILSNPQINCYAAERAFKNVVYSQRQVRSLPCRWRNQNSRHALTAGSAAGSGWTLTWSTNSSRLASSSGNADNDS